jgi:hypothetical protein
MNRLLLQAQKKFRGMKGKIEGTGGFDNTPIPPAKYITEVADSCGKEIVRKGVPVYAHNIQLRIVDGEFEGRMLWPFAPNLSDYRGVLQSADNIQRILGKVLPGKQIGHDWELDFGAFTTKFEEFAAKLIGETVEVTVRHSKQMKDDGTPWIQTYINRGLGEDAFKRADRQVKQVQEADEDDDLNFQTTKPARKRVVAKKKVAKKKVAKKKARKR